ncbi:MAG TPA: DUF4976 domain-containing protein [Planctomycetaceae bacterium]|nr:DUF4976 domain-containing protein [Planctomycetaceae bacterium]
MTPLCSNRRSAAGHAGLLAAGALVVWCTATWAENRTQRPNILVLCSDQQHWRALGFFDSFFETPHQDALAREAVVFKSAFCTTPQCSPSRSSLLTGLYPHRTGMLNNVGALGGTHLARPTLGKMLQQAGYTTGYFGKWHLGRDPVGNAGWSEQVRRGPDEATTRRGLDFLRRHAQDEAPWVLFLMYVNPHDIYHYRPGSSSVRTDDVTLPESWARQDFSRVPSVQKQFMTDDQGRFLWRLGEDAWKGYRDFYRQKVRLYDDQVGRVLTELKRLGLWDETVIVATSDHGDMDTHHRLVFKGPFMYEQLIRIPMIIRVPEAFGGIGHRIVTDSHWVHVDLTPTLLDLAGIKPPDCDGRSAKPVLTGRGAVRRREFVISQYYGKQTWINPIRTIRTHRFKYNLYIEHGEELYDLKNDPGELTNLARDPTFASAKARLRRKLDQWIAAHDDPFYTFETTPLKRRPGARPLPGETR